MGKWLIIIGLLLVVLGLLLHYVPWTLNWFGKLPGDIHKLKWSEPFKNIIFK